MKRIIAMILMLSLLLFACKAGTSKQDINNIMDDKQNSNTKGLSDSSNSAGKETLNPDSKSPSTSTATGDNKKLADILSKSNIQYMVTYDMAIQAAGQTITSTVAEYMKGVSMFRMDSKTLGIESRSIMKDTKFYSCTNSGSWTCYSMEIPEQQKVQQDVMKNPANYNVVFTGKRTIAGASADCFKIANVNGADVEYCYTSEGVPLYVKTSTAQGSTEMTATKYTTSVSDADFILPAEATATQMPGIPTSASGTAPAGSDQCQTACQSVPEAYRSQCLASC